MIFGAFFLLLEDRPFDTFQDIVDNQDTRARCSSIMSVRRQSKMGVEKDFGPNKDCLNKQILIVCANELLLSHHVPVQEYIYFSLSVDRAQDN